MKMTVAGTLCGLALALNWHAAVAETKPFQVVDANKALMGRFYSAPTLMGVQLTVGQKRYLVPLQAALQPDGRISPTALDFQSGDLLYNQPACGGPAYTRSRPWGTTFAATSVSGSGQVLLYPAGASSVFMGINSSRTPDGTCQDYYQGDDSLVPLGAPVDITSRYARPFVVK